MLKRQWNEKDRPYRSVPIVPHSPCLLFFFPLISAAFPFKIEEVMGKGEEGMHFYAEDLVRLAEIREETERARKRLDLRPFGRLKDPDGKFPAGVSDD